MLTPISRPLLPVGGAPPSGPGRPRLQYRPALAANEDWGIPSPYEELSVMLVRVLVSGRSPREVGVGARTEKFEAQFLREVEFWSRKVEGFEIVERLSRLSVHREPVVRPRLGNRLKPSRVRRKSSLKGCRQSAQIADRGAS